MWGKRDKLGRRVLSGLLACLLIATSSVNSLGSITTFAAETEGLRRVSYGYEGRGDVRIGVMAENESFGPGERVELKILIQNNTDQTISGGTLRWRGDGLEDAGVWGLEDDDFHEEWEKDMDPEEAADSGMDGAPEAGADQAPDVSEDADQEVGAGQVSDASEAAEVGAGADQASDTSEDTDPEAQGQGQEPRENPAEESGQERAPEEEKTANVPEDPYQELAQEETDYEADRKPAEDSDEESDGRMIKDMELAPGEIYEARFYGVVDPSLEVVRTRKITFSFSGKKEDGQRVETRSEFAYNTGLATMLPVEFQDGNTLITNEENVMYLRTMFNDEDLFNGLAGPGMGEDKKNGDNITILDPDADDFIDKATDSNASQDGGYEEGKDQNKATASDADRKKPEAPTEKKPSVQGPGADAAEEATPSDAEKEEEATPSDGDREDEPHGDDSTSDNPSANDSASKEETKSEDEESDEEEEDLFKIENFDPENISYRIITYGARLRGVSPRYQEAGGEDGSIMTAVGFRVADNTAPGMYFGTVTATLKHKDRTYETSQGFFFYVTGDGEMTLRGGYKGAVVEVKGDASSFPEGEVLRLKVSEVSEEQEPVLAEAMAKKEEETGISVNRMKALDIKVMADGQEQELTGPVTVTFTGVELEPVAQAVPMALDGENGTKASVETEVKAIEEVEDGENLAVWHLDEAAVELNDMGGRVEDGSVVMDTDHFSVFVIVTGNQVPEDGYHLVFEHWMNAGGNTPYTKQYKDSWPADANGNRIKIGKNFRVSDFVREGNYQLASVELYEMVMENGQPKTNKDGSFVYGQQPYKTVQNQPGNGESEIVLEKNTVAVLRYQPKSGTYTTDVKFYDYDVGQTLENGVEKGAGPETGINSPENYEGGQPNRNPDDRNKTEIEEPGQWLSVGTAEKNNYPLANVKNVITYEATRGRNVSAPNYHLYLKDGRVTSKYRPDANGGSGSFGDTTIKEGIIKGLSGSNYETVEFGTNRNGQQIYDPGLFTDEAKIGKDIYDNYDLIFNQQGDAYKLDRVINTIDGSTTSAATKNLFFPLDHVAYGQLFYKPYEWNANGTEKRGYAHNFFFGMRYDFQFELGDYIGDLTYSFTGDDDVWVFLDGQLILDMGGIHTIYPNDDKDNYPDYWRNDVNLWSFLNGKSYEEYDKEAKYDSNLSGSEAYTKRHQITVLYMERGGSDSNCGMEFKIPNLTPVNVTTTETEVMDLTIEKKWYADNIAVSSIRVQILQDRKNYREVTLNSGSQWKRTESGLPVQNPKTQKPYTYTVKEITQLSGYDNIVSYSSSSDGMTATIKNIQKGDVAVKKVWADENNKEGTRPDHINVQLYKQIEGGETEEGEAVVLKASNNWSYIWKGKRLYTDDNKKVTYRVEEVPDVWLKTQDNPNGWYDAVITGSQETEFTITNTYKPQNDVAKKVIKVWNDDNDRFGLRPTKLYIQLQQNGKDYGDPIEITPDASGHWKTAEWKNLPRYKYTASNGTVTRAVYKYTVYEKYADNEKQAAEYYKDTYSSNNGTEGEVTITNTLQMAEFKVQKHITNYDSPLENDEFFIEVKNSENGKNSFHAGVKLKHNDTSASIKVPVKKTGSQYKITEAMPMEYSKSSNGFLSTAGTGISAEGEVITLMPGAENAVVTVNNTFGHKGYFHGSAKADNDFGQRGTPIASQAIPVSFAAIIPEREEGNGTLLDEDQRLM